jgi:hypothetical protein
MGIKHDMMVVLLCMVENKLFKNCLMAKRGRTTVDKQQYSSPQQWQGNEAVKQTSYESFLERPCKPMNTLRMHERVMSD